MIKFNLTIDHSFQSAEVLESVKRDLGELTTIVTNETNNIVLNTTNVVKETLQVCSKLIH